MSDEGGSDDARKNKRQKRRHSSDDEPVPHKRTTLDPEAQKIAEHYNNIQEHGLAFRDKSPIFFMRNLNNWIKSTLIGLYAAKITKYLRYGDYLKALDLCCGKGGDLIKWNRGDFRLKELVAVDIAEQSIEDCKERFRNMRNVRYKAQFLVADCGEVRIRSKFLDPSIKFDLVSCQFAFHYAFQSLSRAETFFQNASECLRPDGYFIGTIPNSNRIISRARKSEDRSFGNRVYDVKLNFDPNGPIPLFGAEYKFHLEGVVDCPEYLVHFPTLVELAKKYDLELSMAMPFEEFIKDNLESQKFFINKMKCLEYYNTDRRNNLIHPEDQYDHVKKYIDKHPNHTRIVQSMSQCEWDVICKYTRNYNPNLFTVNKYFFIF